MVHEITIKELIKIYPLLQKCYGFDYYEIAKELDNCQSKTLLLAVGEQTEMVYDNMDLDLKIGISVNEEFETQKNAIISLCPNNDEAVKILIFMAAIFNRDMNAGTKISKKNVRPEMLKLLVAISKLRNDDSFFFACKFGMPESISNTNGWFSEMVTDYLLTELGTITLEEAKNEIATWDIEHKGRRAKKPLRNYIILSTYNLIRDSHLIHSI